MTRCLYIPLTMILLFLASGFAHADMTVLLSAAADPAAAPDATDPVTGEDVWTFSGTGNGNSFLGNSNFGSSWGINSGGSTVSDTAQIEADLTALVADSLDLRGTMISIDFDNGGIGSNGVVGVRFLNAAAVQTEMTLRRFGEYQVEGVDTGIQGTTSGINVKLSLTDGLGGYDFLIDDVVVFSGMFSNGAGVDSIQVFANQAGSFTTDVFANNLLLQTIPEPATFGSFLIGLVLVNRRRRS